MDNKKRFPVTNIGTASLLMVFIVLCMVIFAALSLSEAIRDYHYTEKLATQTTEFYTASNVAEEKLASIDQTLRRLYEASDPVDLYDTLIADTYMGDSSASDADIPIHMQTDDQTGSITLSYQVPVNDKHALSVSLGITEPDQIRSDGYYQILSWKEISTAEWNGDNSIQLIQP